MLVSDPEPTHTSSEEPEQSSSQSSDQPLPAELKAVNEAVMDEDSVRGSAFQEDTYYFRG